jgi:UDP-glucose 4-epimerase
MRNNIYKWNKVIVTGGGGFIGSHLVDKLISMGVEVHVIDKLPKNINPKAHYHPFDISIKLDVYSQIFKNADIIFHLAAETSVQESIENPQLHHNTNITGTLNMLDEAKSAKIKRFVFSSSSAIYGEPLYTPINEIHAIQPLSPYALTKAMGEQYCALYAKLYDLNTVSLRYFNVYGDRMNDYGAYRSVISVFKEQSFKKQPLNIVNDGKQKRDFIHVNDIVQANILSALIEESYNVYNVGTGNGYSVNQIADMFGGEKNYGEKRIEPKNSIANSDKIKKELKWSPSSNLKEWIKNL